jgi:hypothetical protein
VLARDQVYFFRDMARVLAHIEYLGELDIGWNKASHLVTIN